MFLMLQKIQISFQKRRLNNMARKSRRKTLNTSTMTYTDDLPDKQVINKTAVYARLSIADNRLENGASLDNQIEYIKAALAGFSDINIVETYSDNGFSGTNFNRDGWEHLMNEIKAGRINCIAVKDLSRLGRNSLEAGNYLEKIFPFMNVRFISINDNYDSNYNDYNKSMVENAFKNLINEFYARDISKKITSALNERRKLGYIVTARIPYGYKRSADNKQLLPDENTAPVVRKIFEWILSGKRICEIIEILNTLAIPSPSKYLYLQSGGKKYLKHENARWYANTIEHILENVVYTGVLVQKKSNVCIFNAVKKVKLPEKDWLTIENAHTPLISKEDFDFIQKRREGNVKKISEVNLLKNKIFCGKCGAILTKRKMANSRYYCASHTRIFKDMCNISIKEKEIKSTISEIFDRYIEMYADISNLALKIYNSSKYKNKINCLKKQIMEKNKELTIISNKIADLYEDLKSEIISAYEFEYIKASYSNEYQKTKEDLSGLEQEYQKSSDIKNIDKKLKGIISQINKAKADDKFIFPLVKSIVVYPEKRIEVEFVFADIFSDTLDYLKSWEVSK